MRNHSLWQSFYTDYFKFPRIRLGSLYGLTLVIAGFFLCSIEKRSQGDGSNLVQKMVVLFVPNVGLFISCFPFCHSQLVMTATASHCRTKNLYSIQYKLCMLGLSLLFSFLVKIESLKMQKYFEYSTDLAITLLKMWLKLILHVFYLTKKWSIAISLISNSKYSYTG